VGEDGGEEGDGSGGVSEDDNCGMHCLTKLTAPLRETQAHSSSLTHGGEIKGLFPNPLMPFICVVPLINVFASPIFHITTS